MTTLSESLLSDRVRNLRLRDVCAVASGTPIGQVVTLMADRKVGCALVMDRQGRLRGVFTERDYLNRVVAAGVDVSLPVDTAMTPSPRTVGLDASVFEAVERMERGGFRHLPVVGEDGAPVGMLSVKSVIHYLVEYFPAKIYNLPPQPDAAKPAREGA